MFARLPPSSSDLAERESVVPPSPPADRRREHREAGAVVTLREREACFNEVAKLSAAAVFWNKVKQFERESAGSEVEAIKAVQAGPTDLAVVPVRS
jgi:hypothetical protein